MRARKVAYLGVLCALALGLGFVERFFILPVQLPGIKLGLANLPVVIALYLLGYPAALLVDILRVILSGFLFAGTSGMLYSMAGALLSFGVMALAKKSGWFSLVAVSVLGGIFHNVGQLLIAAYVTKTPGLMAAMSVILIAGAVMGAVNGVIAEGVLRVVKKVRLHS